MSNILLKRIREIIAEDADTKEIVRKGMNSFGFKILGLLCSSLFALFVAKSIGASAWGIYSLSMAILTIATIISLLGLDTAAIRFNAEFSSQSKEGNILKLRNFSYKIIIVSSLTLSVLIFFSAETLASFFEIPNMAYSIKIISFAVLPFSIALFNARALRGLKIISKSIFLEAVAYPLFNLTIIIALMIFFADKSYIAIYSLVCSLCIVAVLSYKWYNKSTKSFKQSQSTNFGRSEIFKVSLPLMLASSIMFFKGWIDTLMIGMFLSDSDVGIYNIALKLATIATLPLAAINSIAAPKFAELNRNKSKLQEVIQISTFLIFLFSLPLLLIFIIFPNPILGFIGTEYLPAVTALILLSIGQFVNSISGSVGYLLQMTGRQMAYQNITLIITLFGIGLNYILIPEYGITGAAISTFTTTIVWNLTCVAYVKIKLNLLTFLNPFYIMKKII